MERDVEGFCGWDFLIEIMEAKQPNLSRGLFSALFVTGGRINEVLSLRKEQVDFNIHPGIIVIHSMVVIKRKKEIGYRTFPIKRAEPVTPYFEEYVRNCNQNKLFPICDTTAWKYAKKVGKEVNKPVPMSRFHSSDLYLHWFRAQRTCQLREEYDFDDLALKDFFGWVRRDLGAVAIYSRESYKKLARRMGVEI